MRRLFLAVALSLAASCAGSIEPAVEAPVEAPMLCRLQTRDRVLTVYVAGGPVRYAVHGADHRLLARGADLDELRLREPALYRLYRSVVATGGTPVLYAN